MAIQITPDLFVAIWLSAVVSAVLTRLLGRNILRITKYKGLNVILTALIFGFFILVGAIIILIIFEVVA